MAASRQLKRIESASKSPIYSHFTESLNGMSTIRAFNKEALFTEKMNQLIDKNVIHYQATILCNTWLGIRLETCGNLFTLLACVFIILNRGSISSGNAGMIISLALSVSNSFLIICKRISILIRLKINAFM